MFGSKWTSKFWDYTKTLFTEKNKITLTNVLSNIDRDYGVHSPSSTTNWQQGMI